MPIPAVAHCLSITAPAQPPSEFKIFSAGENSTSKGTFLFDEQAAESVMAAYHQEGVDLPIDLEHGSLDPAANNYDPDARGWFKLEVRAGELWAVSTTWTPDGQRRLSERTQRYISPAFTAKDGRVEKMLNVALVAMPATHGAAPVAAGKFGRETSDVISARVGKVDAERFRAAAQKLGKHPGVLLRGIVALTAKAKGKTPEQILAGIGEILGLDDTSPEAVKAAIQAIFDEIPPAGDPLDESAEPKPDPGMAKLSKEAREYCARKKITSAEFLRRAANTVRNPSGKPKAKATPRSERKPLTVETLSREQWDQIRRAGMRPEEFVTRFNALLKR